MYKIEIYRYHATVDTFKTEDILELLYWYRYNYSWSYDDGHFAFTIYINDEILTFDNENKLGFYKYDYDDYSQEYKDYVKEIRKVKKNKTIKLDKVLGVNNKTMKTITLTQEYIQMLINLLKVDGQDVVRHKLEKLIL